MNAESILILDKGLTAKNYYNTLYWLNLDNTK